MTSLPGTGSSVAAAHSPATTPTATAASSVSDLYRAIWRFAAGYRRQYLIALTMLGSSTVIKLAIPMLAGRAINTIQTSGPGSMLDAAWLIGGILLTLATAWSLHGPGRVVERKVGVRVRAAMADALYVKLTSLPLGWHESQHSGEIQHRTQQATRALYDFSQSQFIYLQNAINLIGPLVALALLSKATGLVAVAGYILVGSVIIGFDRAMMRLAVHENAAERRYVAGLLDFLGNISTVIGLRLGEASRGLVAQRLSKVFGPLARNIVLNEGKWCAVDLLSALLCWSLVVIYAWSSHRANAGGGALMLGSIFMVYQYAQQAAGVIGTLASNFQNFARVKTDVSGANLIWQAESRAPSVGTVAQDWTHIEAHGIHFHYARGSKGGIKDLSLSLERGARIALIGPSGSGKSTLLRLIAGLYEPQHGYYTVDGETLFGGRHLGSAAMLIPQEAEVFEASVRDNLTFGAEHTEGAIQRAAYIAAFDSVLETLPEGLDTAITERGANLSGGQRQRLALTRGLLAARAGEANGSSILLLDEPTSALDQVTESRFFGRLRERLPGTCIIASVHRMSVLDHFDKVVLMADGMLVDCGTTAELSERQPLFREMLRESDGDAPAPVAAAR